jgi:hypothetical protein
MLSKVWVSDPGSEIRDSEKNHPTDAEHTNQKNIYLKGVCPGSANLHRLKGGASTSSATSPSPPASSTDRGSLGPFLRPIRAKIQGNIYYRT